MKVFKARIHATMNAWGLPPTGPNRIVLPRVHVIDYDVTDVKDMALNDMEAAPGLVCTKPILTMADRAEVVWKNKLVIRQDYEDRQVSWSELDTAGFAGGYAEDRPEDPAARLAAG